MGSSASRYGVRRRARKGRMTAEVLSRACLRLPKALATVAAFPFLDQIPQVLRERIVQNVSVDARQIARDR